MPANNRLRMADRLAFIDSSRAIAAVAVLLSHVSITQYPLISHGMAYWFNPGVFGVTLFFLISGFIIPASIERGGLAKFWTARFFRLFPLYWLSILLAVLLITLDVPISTHAFSGREILLNATMLQEYLRVPHLLGLYWTLGLELLFYLICSTLSVTGLYRHPLVIAWCLAIGLILLVLVCFAAHRSLPFGRIQLLVAAFVGSLLYRIANGSLPIKVFLPLAAVLLTGLVAGAWLRFRLYPGPSSQDHYFSFGCIVASWATAYAVFGILFLKRLTRFPSLLVRLGTISYSIYLLHALVLPLIPADFPPLAGSAVTVVITIVLAHYCYTFIEKPGIELGRWLLNWRPVRHPAAQKRSEVNP